MSALIPEDIGYGLTERQKTYFEGVIASLEAQLAEAQAEVATINAARHTAFAELENERKENEKLRAMVERLSAEALGMRRRIHNIEQHNQWQERCESAWCNPDEKSNPALETGLQIIAARLTPPAEEKQP
jgi:uncharacterized protein (DUF3084 family)